MGIVVVAAVGAAALRMASDLWADALFSLDLLLFGAAALASALRRGRSRAAWLGFAAFGWGYLVLTFGPWCREFIRPRLLTDTALQRLHPRLAGWYVYLEAPPDMPYKDLKAKLDQLSPSARFVFS